MRRTYEALAVFVHERYDRLEQMVGDAVSAAATDAGPDDAQDVALALVQQLALAMLKVSGTIHERVLERTREREPARQLELFPSLERPDSKDSN